jgi:hypothetical protein
VNGWIVRKRSTNPNGRRYAASAGGTTHVNPDLRFRSTPRASRCGIYKTSGTSWALSVGSLPRVSRSPGDQKLDGSRPFDWCLMITAGGAGPSSGRYHGSAVLESNVGTSWCSAPSANLETIFLFTFSRPSPSCRRRLFILFIIPSDPCPTLLPSRSLGAIDGGPQRPSLSSASVSRSLQVSYCHPSPRSGHPLLTCFRIFSLWLRHTSPAVHPQSP